MRRDHFLYSCVPVSLRSLRTPQKRLRRPWPLYEGVHSRLGRVGPDILDGSGGGMERVDIDLLRGEEKVEKPLKARRIKSGLVGYLEPHKEKEEKIEPRCTLSFLCSSTDNRVLSCPVGTSVGSWVGPLWLRVVCKVVSVGELREFSFYPQECFYSLAQKGE